MFAVVAALKPDWPSHPGTLLGYKVRRILFVLSEPREDLHLSRWKCPLLHEYPLRATAVHWAADAQMEFLCTQADLEKSRATFLVAFYHNAAICWKKWQPLKLSQNHRMPWVGRDPKDHQGTISLPQAGSPTSGLILDQAAQGPIQPGCEHLQGWGIHSLSGQPVPAPHHSLGRIMAVSILLLS